MILLKLLLILSNLILGICAIAAMFQILRKFGYKRPTLMGILLLVPFLGYFVIMDMGFGNRTREEVDRAAALAEKEVKRSQAKEEEAPV